MTNPKHAWRTCFAVLMACLTMVLSTIAHAHPMGNFSISHYSGIRIGPRQIELTYLIDLAEIPTYQEFQEAGIVAQPEDARIAPYLLRKAAQLRDGLSLRAGRHALNLEPVSQRIIFTAGAGGLPTMKLGFLFRTPVEAVPNESYQLDYQDDNFAGRTGWKEVIVSGAAGVRISGDAQSRVDRSAMLTNYPTDLLNSPPQDVSASLRVSVDAHATSLAVTTLTLGANQQPTPRNRFTELISGPTWSFWFLCAATLIAAGLGAFHALEPGHGKTIVAAYLVGSRGRPRDAVLLGLIVTMAHTAGVYLLGAVTLYASDYIVPERIYPWLELISGLMIAAIAFYLLLRACAGVQDDQVHGAGTSHRHWFSVPQDNAPPSVPGAPNDARTSLKQLLILGIVGGIVPCPAALVVLLSAVSLHRIGFGLFLIVAFSVGLATVLIGIGLLTVYAKRFMSIRSEGTFVKRWLPIASSACMLTLGLAIAGRAIVSSGFDPGASAHAGSFSVVGITLMGLFLGMRHSTDPDHVIAVATIVTRERSVRRGALIGMLWGVGHTLTVFLVGSAIILVGFAIPPRLGLFLEFCVALMLVVLGVLNLTGLFGRPADRPSIGPAATPTSLRVGWMRALIDRYGRYQLLRPVAIGLVHGLAGSAAVALLVLTVIPNPMWAIAYLLVFGAGTVVGMMLMTTAIAAPVAFAGQRTVLANGFLTQLSGVISAGFGLFLVYQFTVVDGLFSGHVHWTPN